MSRASEDDVAKQAETNASTYNANAQKSFEGANNSITEQQGDVNDYKTQLSKFAAANPYGAGGAYQTSINQATAGTADAASQAAAQRAAAAAVRTGQNASGGVAAGTAADEANTRALMTTQAKANADRINAGAGYGSKVLSASAIPASLQGAITGEQGNLARTEAGAGGEDLGIEQKADDQPDFGDVLGENFAQSFGKAAGGKLGGGL